MSRYESVFHDGKSSCEHISVNKYFKFLFGFCLFLEMYWTAPELLRQVGFSTNGTPKGDIYSFAIIMWELMYNKAFPYQDINLEPKGETELKERIGETLGSSLDWYEKSHQFFLLLVLLEIIMQLRTPFQGEPLRPPLSEDVCEEKINTLLRACWNENPDYRPPFGSIRRQLRDISPDRSGLRYFHS